MDDRGCRHPQPAHARISSPRALDGSRGGGKRERRAGCPQVASRWVPPLGRGRARSGMETPDPRLRPELLAAGFTDGEVQRLRRAGVLTPIRRGAYLWGDDPRSTDPVARHALLVRSTVPGLAWESVVSHISAAVLHGLPVRGGPTHSRARESGRLRRRSRRPVPPSARRPARRGEARRDRGDRRHVARPDGRRPRPDGGFRAGGRRRGRRPGGPARPTGSRGRAGPGGGMAWHAGRASGGGLRRRPQRERRRVPQPDRARDGRAPSLARVGARCHPSRGQVSPESGSRGSRVGPTDTHMRPPARRPAGLGAQFTPTRRPVHPDSTDTWPRLADHLARLAWPATATRRVVGRRA